MLNILVANDDGIWAPGIRHLVDALSQVANVYVCAPHTQRSAAGHGICMSTPIEAEQVEYENAVKAYAVTGLPADCVKLGLVLMKKENIKIDMVFSGINLGGNLGTDMIYSGTVGAAVEGAMNGIPSVAVSVDNHVATEFELACELAVSAVKNAYGKMPPTMVLNINTPDLPKDQIKGVKFTRMGRMDYFEDFREIPNDEGKLIYGYAGERVLHEGLPEDLDVIANQNGYASITPLQYDMTDYSYVDKIKEWEIVK